MRLAFVSRSAKVRTSSGVAQPSRLRCSKVRTSRSGVCSDLQDRDDHRGGVVALLAAAVLRQRELCALDLPLARAPLELLGELHDLREAGGPDGVPLAQQAAGGVHGLAPAELRGPRRDVLAALALGAEPELLVGHDLGGGGRVVDLDHVEVLRAHTGLLVGVARGQLDGVGLVFGVVVARVHHARDDAHGLGDPELARLALAHDDRGCGAVADGGAHRARERLDDHPLVQHVLDGERLLELRAGVQAAVERVLRRDHRELLHRGAVVLHVGPGRRGVDVHEHGAALAGARLAPAGFRGLLERLDHLLQLVDVDGAREGREALRLVGIRELLHAEGEHDVEDPRGDHRRRLDQGRRAAGAGVLDVDDGDLSDADRVEDHLAADRFLPGDQPRGAVAHVGGLEVGELEARVGDGGAHGFRAQLFQPFVGVLHEAGHSDTRDGGVELHVGPPRAAPRP